ncbi:uncharacterized protein FTOL_12356 [Fusarium torulosum]|uniref:Uncharacterized protein n=1 Tax=Fusarium torulosum TaxID=33205 RepID=A0AAE8MKC4_9HYPO|nr:uncharacterized protein FTOL_12356 [Fusarium torulosum]
MSSVGPWSCTATHTNVDKEQRPRTIQHAQYSAGGKRNLFESVLTSSLLLAMYDDVPTFTLWQGSTPQDYGAEYNKFEQAKHGVEQKPAVQSHYRVAGLPFLISPDKTIPA